MVCWIEPVDGAHTRITVVTKRRYQLGLFTTMTESTFHSRFAQAVEIVKAGKPLPLTLPKTPTDSVRLVSEEPGAVQSVTRRGWRKTKRGRRGIRTMFYKNMTVDEAQRIVGAYDEMTDAERATLPIEQRVGVREIREDLAAHKRKWKLE